MAAHFAPLHPLVSVGLPCCPQEGAGAGLALSYLSSACRTPRWLKVTGHAEGGRRSASSSSSVR